MTLVDLDGLRPQWVCDLNSWIDNVNAGFNK